MSYWNTAKPPRRVFFAHLKSFEGSPYKALCVDAVCEGGLVLVDRDNNDGFRLRRDGICVRCGQRYLFLDDEIAGERLPPFQWES